MLSSGAYDARSSAANPLARLPPEYPQSVIVALGEMPENADDLNAARILSSTTCPERLLARNVAFGPK